MSQQGGSLRRTGWRQRAVAIAALAELGLIAGGVFVVLTPPVPTSQALVETPVTDHPAAQVALAGSDQVLSGAVRHSGLPTSLASLRSRVQFKSVDQFILIRAEGPTPIAADAAANAVASSYVAYYSNSPRPTGARVVTPAAIVSGPSLPHRLVVPAGAGALLGALTGAAAMITRSRRRRRLRMT